METVTYRLWRNFGTHPVGVCRLVPSASQSYWLSVVVIGAGKMKLNRSGCQLGQIGICQNEEIYGLNDPCVCSG
jgi:hypothetical protein